MRKIDAIKLILARDKQRLRQDFKVKQIGVFGSYARNEQGAKSDIDILVEFAGPVGLFEFIDLEDYLGGLLKVKVDLVSKKALKPYIGQHILKEVVYA